MFSKMPEGKRESGTVGAHVGPVDKALFGRIAKSRKMPPSALAADILRKWMLEWGRGESHIPERGQDVGKLSDFPHAMAEIELRLGPASAQPPGTPTDPATPRASGAPGKRAGKAR